MSTQIVGLALVGVLAAAACRDGPTLFTPTNDTPPLGPAPYRLTFEPARDVTPTWSVSGDTIFYLVEHPIIDAGPPVDTVRIVSIVHAIPREGGTAVRVFPVLQPSDFASVSMQHATQAPDGTLANFVLGPLYGPLCPGTDAVCSAPADSAAKLRTATVRLRHPLSTTAPAADAILTITYDGREFDTSEQPLGLTGFYRVRQHPFQQYYADSARVSTRVSWSPDGDRLVVSDGLSLIVWSPSTDAVIRVPGSDGALNPTWSPAGDWIAFERLERGTMSETECEHRKFGNPTCFERRTSWSLPGRSLAIIQPDGSSLRLLPDGKNPAWSADGQRLFYESGNAIWSVDLAGMGAAPVPGTDNGIEPALSPDGRHLAFSRVDPMSGDADIWVVDAP